MGLLCYKTPSESVLGFLLDEIRRGKIAEIVYDKLNPKIETNSKYCRVESLLKCLRKKLNNQR